MPRETKPSLVYVVRGEGVRDNSWVVQRPFAPVEYSNPPVEQLDSVPTPFGADLSIRIFEKGTRLVTDFLASNPATAVVAAEAEPMVTPSTQTSRSVPQTSPDPSPPSRPSAPSVPSRPSVVQSALSSNPTSAGILPKPPKAATRPPSLSAVDSRRLRNFRNLSVRIIADPRFMPPPWFLPDPTVPSPPSHAQPKPPQTSAKNASEQFIRKIPTPTPTTLPKPLAMPQERARTSPVHSVHLKTPQVPSLTLPGPASPPKALARETIGVTSPSAFGRWKNSPPVPPSRQQSQQLPSPTKVKPAAADKSRLKPWQKTKAGKSVSSADAGHEKALQDIVEKRMKALPRPSKTLPPLTPLNPPVTRPSQPTPVLPQDPAGAMVTDPVSKETFSPTITEAAGQSAKQSSVSKDPMSQAAGQPPRQPSKRPAQADGIQARKEDSTKARPKAPDADPTSLGNAPSTKATPLAPDRSESRLPSERKLLERASADSNNAVTIAESSSARVHPKTHDRLEKPQPSVSERPPGGITSTARKASTEPPAEIAAPPSPRTSTDEIEVGTARRPIVTKEDLIEARRVRESLGQPKGQSQGRPSQHKVPPSNDRTRQKVVGDKVQAHQRSGSELKVASKTSVISQTPRRDTASLFDSEVQETMKSVIEQVVWTVEHYKRSFGISSHVEMKNSRRRILNFIHVHLDVAASGPDHCVGAKQQSAQLELTDQNSTLSRQVFPKESEPVRRISDLRQTDLKNVAVHRMFIAWKRDIQGASRLKQIASEAEQLRQAVLHCDARIIHFSAKDLITRLKELRDLTFTFQELKKRLPRTKSEIDLIAEKKRSSENDFVHVFHIIKCAVCWIFFLEEQVTQTWKSFLESSKSRALGFARDVFKVLIKESHQTGAVETSNANKGVIKAMRSMKSLIGKLEEMLDLPHDGKPVSLTIQELVSKFADICKFGEEKANAKDIPSGPDPGSDRGMPSTARADSTIRRTPASKLNGNQQSRHPPRGTPDTTSSAGGQRGGKFKSLSRGTAATQHESAAMPAIAKTATSPKSSPAIPRRPSEPVSPRSNQAGPSSRRPTTSSANAPRWQNAEKLNLRSLMESARKVHEPKQKGSAQQSNKRKADEGSDPNSTESDGRPSKKRRVRFAPNLVQGAQSTPYTKKDLQSLFFDGYDLLGNTTALQQAAVEERASQMSRGSVIATFGYIRSYIGALKNERDGHPFEQPEWVRLPYTAAMKKDIHRFMERR